MLSFFGANADGARQRMLRRDLRGRGISDERVLDAMSRVPREMFVQPGDERAAYTDRALPIDCGQTISQPYMVALMTTALELAGDERVLEIGTGSGYQTAILAELAREVVSIERHWDTGTYVCGWATDRWARRSWLRLIAF
jgi:protein-L-isoaspartate(D-aspartate) O-methyltransferase